MSFYIVQGVFPENKYQTVESPLAAGDVLVLYTDGVFEILNPAGKEYGQDRFVQAVRNRLRLRPEQLFAEVLEEVEQFAETDQFPDDVCLVAMEVARINGEEAEPSKTN